MDGGCEQLAFPIRRWIRSSCQKMRRMQRIDGPDDWNAKHDWRENDVDTDASHCGCKIVVCALDGAAVSADCFYQKHDDAHQIPCMRELHVQPHSRGRELHVSSRLRQRRHCVMRRRYS